MVATGLGEHKHEIPWLDTCHLRLAFRRKNTPEESHELSS